MLKERTKVIPVMTGPTGTISKSFRKYTRMVPGKYEIHELQRQNILLTVHILRKVLMYQYKAFSKEIIRPIVGLEPT